MLSILLNGEFVTRERVRLWSAGLILATLVALVFLALTAQGLNDYKGRPLGTDFSDVYAAGGLAREGLAPAAYDTARHHSQEQAIFGQETPFYGWHYPPFFLLVATALSNLPYLPALLLWQALSLATYLIAMRALLRNGPAPELAHDPLWLLAALAFPAVFVNLTHGQNGFLSAALLAGGLALLKPRPVIAGVLFGLLAYKPQFGILLPLALAADRQWKCIGAAAATVLGLIALVTLCFGFEVWTAFFDSMAFSRTVVLEQGSTGFQKIQSVFAAVRLAGGSIGFAYAAQGAVMIALAVAVARLWRGPATPALKGAGLCIAALLSTPYCLDYDLMLLAPAIALAASEGRVRGFRAGELLILSALWLVPLMAREFAGATHLALAPLVIGLGFVMVLRRA